MARPPAPSPERPGGPPGPDRRETEKERLDRNLSELLQELRVALPGVQVLFAFLLVVPFNERFAHVTSFQRTTYFATLLCTLAASALLIAPSMQHRLAFRRDRKREIVLMANRLTIAGLGVLAVAMIGVAMLITDVLYGPATVAVVTAAAAALFALLWLVVPLRRLG